jgi:hypothetical protein
MMEAFGNALGESLVPSMNGSACRTQSEVDQMRSGREDAEADTDRWNKEKETGQPGNVITADEVKRRDLAVQHGGGSRGLSGLMPIPQVPLKLPRLRLACQRALVLGHGLRGQVPTHRNHCAAHLGAICRTSACVRPGTMLMSRSLLASRVRDNASTTSTPTAEPDPSERQAARWGKHISMNAILV